MIFVFLCCFSIKWREKKYQTNTELQGKFKFQKPIKNYKRKRYQQTEVMEKNSCHIPNQQAFSEDYFYNYYM